MDFAAVLQALADIRDTDPPTTKKAANRAASDAADVLGPLREWLDELDGLLTEAESAAELLDEADADDREEAHSDLTTAVSDVRDHLLPDQVMAPAGVTVTG